MLSVPGVIVSTEEPEYDTVPLNVALPLLATMIMPTVVEAKFPLLTVSTLDFDNDSNGLPLAVIPVPLSVTADGLPAALCVMVNVAL